jgi:hypothetical protein
MASSPSKVLEVKRDRKRPLPLAAAFRAAKAAGFQSVTCEVTPEGTMILRAGSIQDDKFTLAEDTDEIIL